MSSNPAKATRARQSLLEGQQAIDALLDPKRMNPPYRPKCEDCKYDGGAYLLGPVALKNALDHTKAAGHKVTIYEGDAAT